MMSGRNIGKKKEVRKRPCFDEKKMGKDGIISLSLYTGIVWESSLEYFFDTPRSFIKKVLLYLHSRLLTTYLMKVFSLLSLGRNLASFISTGKSNSLITRYGFLCNQHTPYGCGVLFICARLCESLFPDERMAPHFLLCMNPFRSRWEKACMRHGKQKSILSAA